jgi:hypothetical protein
MKKPYSNKTTVAKKKAAPKKKKPKKSGPGNGDSPRKSNGAKKLRP